MGVLGGVSLSLCALPVRGCVGPNSGVRTCARGACGQIIISSSISISTSCCAKRHVPTIAGDSPWTATECGPRAARSTQAPAAAGRRVVASRTPRRQGGCSGEGRSGSVAPATRPDAPTIPPGMCDAWVLRSVPIDLWMMRAQEWRSRRHDEPVLPRNCDLRFSFPQSSLNLRSRTPAS